MFSRLSVISCVLAMALAATATPHGGDWGNCKQPTTTTVTALSTVTATVTTTSTAAVSTATSITIDQCNTGSIQCCNSVTHANSTFGQAVTSLLGVNATHPNTLMGMNCSPMDSNSTEPICEASPICCENNAHGGLISIGCIIIEM